MARIWQVWLTIWAISVIGFGLILTGGGLEATGAPTMLLLDILNGPAPLEATPTLRFALGVCGPVSMGWGLTTLYAMRAAIGLGHQGRWLWQAITISVFLWFIPDSILSVATGFWRNVIPNIGYMGAFLIPVLASGVLRGGGGMPVQSRA